MGKENVYIQHAKNVSTGDTEVKESTYVTEKCLHTTRRSNSLHTTPKRCLHTTQKCKSTYDTEKSVNTLHGKESIYTQHGKEKSTYDTEK